MKSENDILAEYVRKNYPNIACSLEFIVYRIGVKIGEAVSCIVESIQGAEIAESGRKESEENE